MSILRDTQERIWRAVKSASLPVYLVGGTALAFRYDHRESEDLDFFCQPKHWSRSLHQKVAAHITKATKFRQVSLREAKGASMVGMAHYEFQAAKPLVIKVDIVQDFDRLLHPVAEDGIASADDLYLRKVRAAIGWGPKETIIGRSVSGGRQAEKDLYDLWWLSTHYQELHTWFPRHFQFADYTRFVQWSRGVTAGHRTVMGLLRITPQPDVRMIRAHMDRQAELLNRRFMP